MSTSDSPYTHHVEPTLAISENDVIFAGWKNAFSHNGPGVRVSFSKSTNNGKDWSEPFDMPMFKGINTGQSDPWLVWHDEILYYAYLEYSIDSYELSQITVAKSTSLGDTWSPVAASYGEGFADKETMTVSNDGTVYVAYDDINYNTNVTTVRLTRSIDNGDNFDEVGVIIDSETHPEDHLGPYVTTDSNNDVYVAWVWFFTAWGDVYLVASQDQGETFSEQIDLNPLSENATFETTLDQRPSRATLPVIRFDMSDRLYVLWADRHHEGGEWDIFIRYSDDYGLNWSDRYQVNPKRAGNQWQPEMDIDSNGRVHVVWYDEHEDTYGPYYRMLIFSNETGEEVIYSDPVAIASVNTSSTFTRPGDYFTIKVDSKDFPHVVWSDGRENEMDIYYSHGITEPVSTSADKTSIFPNIFVIIIPIALFVSGIWKKKRSQRN
ncbi:MAG: exo-alpha-sialidase [Candidatus Heimdallarchaeota archaeon]|nr:MAG: exo-alpha-sialidase [Candidatus Heimdallarchaeota archaeon]